MNHWISNCYKACVTHCFEAQIPIVPVPQQTSRSTFSIDEAAKSASDVAGVAVEVIARSASSTTTRYKRSAAFVFICTSVRSLMKSYGEKHENKCTSIAQKKKRKKTSNAVQLGLRCALGKMPMEKSGI
jgi:hypothetical protein